MVSGGLVFFHSYVTVQFLYDSRIVSKSTMPLKLFENLPYALYVAPIAYFCYYLVSENSKLIRRLDAKYTPIWVKITEE